MKSYKFKLTGVIDANNEEIAQAIIKNKLIGTRGISEINVESVEETK